jgi:Trypsin-like peptidase domain
MTIRRRTASPTVTPFFTDPGYIEPMYDPYWFCKDPPNWENAACITDPGDVRARVSRTVGMIISIEADIISTCSVTLIHTNQIITAEHCMDTVDPHSSSVTFDYEPDCNGNRLPGYNPKFIKVTDVLDLHHDASIVNDIDFSRLRLATAPPGIPPIQMRPDLPAVGEQIFGVHHPNGAVKKLSIPHTAGFDKVDASSPSGVLVPKNFHVSGGSSGSGLFDAAGRIVGVLADGCSCGIVHYVPQLL